METEYRIIATMTFSSAADRDEWYTAVRTSVINARNAGNLPAWKKAHMTKDDYIIPGRTTEDMEIAT